MARSVIPRRARAKSQIFSTSTSRRNSYATDVASGDELQRILGWTSSNLLACAPAMERRHSLFAPSREPGGASFLGKLCCVIFIFASVEGTHAWSPCARAQEATLRPFVVVTKCIHGRSNTVQPFAYYSHLSDHCCSTNEMLRRPVCHTTTRVAEVRHRPRHHVSDRYPKP